jgi:hypothetical protein
MKEFKNTTIFSSKIKPLVSEEKDQYLAMASLMDVADFIPDIDTEKNIDLLPIAFNAFVANRVNKNDDVLDGETAVLIAENFINKPINIEHDRHKVIGTILNVGFSEFGTDKSLAASDIKNIDGPFNVTLGGVLWRVVNNSLTDMIEEASDPTSPFYQKISASWELGFDDYQLVLLPDGKKNIEDAEILTDEEEIGEAKANLRSLGGTGEYKDKKIYRKTVGNVVPLGIGLTENPAADVVGVATESSNKDKENLFEEKEEKIEKAQEEGIITENRVFEKNSSHVQETDVIENKDSVMEIKSINDINEETLKEVSASSVTEFIQSELEKASEEFAAEKVALEDAVKAESEKNEALQTEHNAVKEELDKLKANLEQLEAEKIERDRIETFNERMSTLDDQYVLSDAERELIASEIKDMGEEDFSAYATKLEVFLKDKSKEAIAEKEAAASEEVVAETTEVVEETVASEEVKAEEVTEEAAAEVQEETASEEEVIEEAIDQAEQVEAGIPVTAPAEEPTVQDKYKDAFSIDNFDIKL